MVEFIPLGELDEQDWGDFVESSDEAWLEHHPLFVRMNASRCVSFGVKKDKKIVAVCLLYKYRRRKVNILSGPGLALANHVARAKIINAVREHLVKLAFKNDCVAITFVLPPLAVKNMRKSGYWDSCLADMGFSSGNMIGNGVLPVQGVCSVIDLGKGREDIVKGMSGNNRRFFTKANARDDIAFDLLSGEENASAWEDFANIHQETFQRTGAEPYSVEYMQGLRGLFLDGKARVARVTEDGKCVASALLTCYKGGVDYHAGGCTDEALSWGASVYLQVKAMLAFKEDGFTRYNLGPYFPAIREGKMAGIGFFKSRFGGNKIPYNVGTLMLDDDRFFWGCMFPDRIRSSLRSWYRKFKGGKHEAL